MKTKKILTLSLLTAFVLATILSVGMGAFAFSDEYEPIYPHPTAATRTVDEIYDRVSGKDVVLPEEVVKARKEMIQMYKDVGIDISYDMENWLASYKIIANYPQRWSTETPIPLGESPDYAGAFSIDAPWNNKIPEGSPRVLIPRTGLSMHAHIGVVKANIDAGGWGTGIPQIVSTSADPFYTIASKYNSAEVSRVYKLHAKAGLFDYVNNAQTGDEHIMFIDAESNTGVQIWKATVPGDPRGFDLTNYRIPGFDVRAKAASIEYKLDGIGAEGQTGVNAVNVPTNAFTIKSSEISSTTEMLNHAVGGAIGQMIGGRAYPGISTDSHMVMEADGTGANNHTYNKGVVPYGGIIQLDPEIDLKAMYDGGKLSFHAYRMLRAMQEYGFYNIDCSGGSSFFFYTSTYSKDWVNSDFRGFDVPYKNNAQGFSHVVDELTAFFKGDSFFGLSGEPGIYVTIPVAKYADLDVNDDGVIDIADHDLVAANVGVEYTDATKQYDVNQDKEISPADIEIMYNYLNDQPMHTFTWYDATYTDNDETHGRIIGSAFSRKMDGVVKYRDGMMVSFAAVPFNGYEFDGWTGDFAKYGKEPVVKLLMDKDYSFGAKYKKKEEVNFTVKVVGPGHVEVSENAITYGAPKEKYGVDTLLKLKAVADEGYAFLGWSGDIIGYTNPAGFLLSEDSEVIALFGEPGYADPIDPEQWATASGVDTAYKISAGKNITFSDWTQGNQIVINKNTDKEIDMSGDYALRATFENKADATNAGKLIFNYKDNKNYYYVKLGADGSFSFGKVYKGVSSVMKTSKLAVEGDTQFKNKVTLEAVKSGSYITINGYKDGVKHEYCKVREKSLTGGTYGVGTEYLGALTVTGFNLTKTVADASKAAVQVWSPTGNNDPWLERLRGAVAVAAGSSKAYANDDYTSIPGDGSIMPYFGADGTTVYVPVRYVTETLGGKVTYDPATDSVVVSYGEHSGSFKAWVDGAQEVNGTLYVPGDVLAKALGKEYYQYEGNAPVIFSDKVNVYDPNSEPECIEFIKKAFDMQYYM